MVDRLQANADAMRDELAARGLRGRGLHDADRPARRRRRRAGDARLRAGDRGAASSPRRSGRRRCPPGTSRLRLALMATHTREELRAAARTLGRAALQAGFRPGAGVPLAAAAARRPSGRAPGRRRRAPRRPDAARRIACRTGSAGARRTRRPASRARPLRHRDRHRGRQDRRRRGADRGAARRAACRSAPSSRSSPGSTTSPSDGKPHDHELLAACAGMAPQDVAPVPLRPGGLAAPGRRAGGRRRSTPRCWSTPRARRRGPDARSPRASAGCWCPLTLDGYLVRDLVVELGLPVVVVARPGLGTINHTLLTLEAARAAGSTCAAS